MLLTAAAGLATSVMAVAVPVGSAAAASSGTTTYVADAFSRTVAGGWGSAGTGGAYALLGKAQTFSVANGAGTMAVASGSERATLSKVSAADVDASMTVAVPAMPSGGSDYAELVLRHTSSEEYRAKLHFASDGSADLSVSRVNNNIETTVLAPKQVTTNAPAGTQITVRAMLSGSSPVSVKAKAWLTSASQPSAWLLSGQDSSSSADTGAGSVAVLSRVSGTAASSTPFNYYALSVQSISAPPPPPASQDGSVAVGSTSYAVPSGAHFVSPSGKDSNAGTQAKPWQTLSHAVTAAPAGSTIVLRAGVYHETVKTPVGKALTIQSYPGEAVWLDGSVPITSWVSQSSGVWRSDNWTAQFPSVDANSTNKAFWNYINSSYPMAGHPDQVFYDGAQLTQVGSQSAVGAGDFYVDYPTHQLFIGNNPSGHAVRGTTLSTALLLQGGVTVRGIGIRDYASPVGSGGAINVATNNISLQNLVVNDIASAAISVAGTHATIDQVTVQRAGQVGLTANEADYMQVQDSLFDTDNQQHFNIAPVAGGVKCTSCRFAEVNHNTITNTAGNGIWFDKSSYSDTIISNLLVSNAGPGIHFEISGYGVIASNVVVNEGQAAILIADANNVRIWNNTLENSMKNINIMDGPRVASDQSAAGHDPRYPNDPNVTWVTDAVQVHNNVDAISAANSTYGVDDANKKQAASKMVTTSHNAFYRTSTSSPSWLINWCNYGGSPSMETFTTLAAMQKATGQEGGSMATSGGTDPYISNSTPSIGHSYQAASNSPANDAGQALPSDIAADLGQPSGVAVSMGTLTR